MSSKICCRSSPSTRRLPLEQHLDVEHPRHNDPKVDEFYARYARELAGKRKTIAKELVEFMVDKMYWNNISGSPFYMVAQPWMKGYTYNAEFEALRQGVAGSVDGGPDMAPKPQGSPAPRETGARLGDRQMRAYS